MFTGGATVNAQLPKMPESGIFSRRFDFSEIFTKDELNQQIKFKFINHTKKTEFIGFLDELGRTQRFYSDSADKVEAIILGNDTQNHDELFVIKNDLNSTKNQDSSEDCCGGDDDDHYHNTEELFDDSDLEADFKSFGL